METRAALLARGLARSGRWHVRMVVSDFGQPRRVRLEGIEFDVYQPYFVAPLTMSLPASPGANGFRQSTSTGVISLSSGKFPW